jgi:mono/diheme cytochrome c family protein
MKRLAMVLFAVVVALALTLPAFAGDAEKSAAEADVEKKVEPAGKKIFLDSNCALCHTVYSEAIGEPPVKKEGEEEVGEAKEGEKEEGKGGPPDLSVVGATRTSEWLHALLVEKREIDGVKHMQRFKGEDAEWSTLSEWLLSLGAPEEPAEAESPAASTPAPADDAAPAEGSE